MKKTREFNSMSKIYRHMVSVMFQPFTFDIRFLSITFIQRKYRMECTSVRRTSSRPTQLPLVWRYRYNSGSSFRSYFKSSFCPTSLISFPKHYTRRFIGASHSFWMIVKIHSNRFGSAACCYCAFTFVFFLAAAVDDVLVSPNKCHHQPWFDQTDLTFPDFRLEKKRTILLFSYRSSLSEVKWALI